MEGPSLIILREEIEKFIGKKIISVSGNVKTIGKEKLINLTIKDFNSWGKHFLIVFKNFYLRIHFLMFGSYTVDKPKNRESRLSLFFRNGALHLYTCSVREFPGSPENEYDWSFDLMSDKWSSRKTISKVKKGPDRKVCDILLDQEIFGGSGNIIKNEVLFRLLLNPDKKISKLTTRDISALVNETRKYSHDFYQWKKIYALRKNWKIYKKKKCVRCKGPVLNKITGVYKRRTFYCPSCQK